MDRFRELVTTRKNWVVNRVRARMAAEAGPWDIDPMVEMLVGALNSDDNGALVAEFGRTQAAAHRVRGLGLTQFVGVLKHMRDAFRALVVEQGGVDLATPDLSTHRIDRLFDDLELSVLATWRIDDDRDAWPGGSPAGRDPEAASDRYRQVFEALAAPIVLIDDTGAIDGLNPAAHDLFAGPSVPGAVYYGEDDMPYLSEDLLRLVREIEDDARCARIMHTRHGIRHFEIAITHLMNGNGAFAGSMLLFDDATRRTEAKETLKREKDRLEDLVAMRTAEIGAAMAKLRDEEAERKAIEESLTKTIDQLAKSNTELERFANFASHDLKESARLVASYAELVNRRLDTAADDAIRDFLRFLAESGKRMSQQVEDLLAYSRTQTRARPFADADAGRIVGAALANLDDDIRDSGADVRVGPLPRLWCDEFQIQEVFQHLIGNAIKFRHPERSPGIEIGADVLGDEAVLYARDNGIGIDPMFADQIFVIFKRLHTKDMYPGSGIGLALCKRIVERHGGRIWLDSVIGEGTLFRFTLPIADAPARSPAPRRAAR